MTGSTTWHYQLYHTLSIQSMAISQPSWRGCLKTLFSNWKRHGYRPIWFDIHAVFDGLQHWIGKSLLIWDSPFSLFPKKQKGAACICYQFPKLLPILLPIFCPHIACIQHATLISRNFSPASFSWNSVSFAHRVRSTGSCRICSSSVCSPSRNSGSMTLWMFSIDV